MACLQIYFDDHAAQARLHENQRQVMTMAVLGVAGMLIGLVTLGSMSIWSLPAAIAITALGVFGALFSGKHYERFNYHMSMMKAIRDEMDRVAEAAGTTPKSIGDLRTEVEREHYFGFVWPKFYPTRCKPQAIATSWIARQRLHMFWESVHAGIAVIGLLLCLFIMIKAALPGPKEALRIGVPNAAAS
jgi:hypothetical protein